MKVSLNWLAEFVAHGLDTDTLVRKLTFAGIEVEGVERLAPRFTGVVAARIAACERHPAADKLSVCTVDAGDGKARQVVCGAPNARVGLVAPFAAPGAELPGGMKIEVAKLRGVESHGMLCSAKELGLDENASGLMELAPDAGLGVPLGELLALDDTVLELKVTPNRGDCLSMLGVAREVATLAGRPLRVPATPAVAARIGDQLTVRVDAPADCACYAGRLVRGIRADARSPQWLQERLRRAGLRSIHPVVDVTNYVMLEFGQPMHGFDAATLAGGIVVRRGRAGERVILLDGRAADVDEHVLLICDGERPRALGGVMGGADSGVSADTRDVFLESAWFKPTTVAGRARRFGLHTDAAQRFERGVDPTGQVRALERATVLLTEIAGGQPGPVTVVRSDADLPQRAPVRLRRERIGQLLGIQVPDAEVVQVLGSLGLEVRAEGSGWRVTPPGFRFDLEREEDLVEEVGRIHGYERIVPARFPAPLQFLPLAEAELPIDRVKDALVDRGYEEVVTYSFVDPVLQAEVHGSGVRPRLANPIAADMAEMRASLLPGLLTALRWNLARQQDRVRLFEHGIKFDFQSIEIKEKNVISGIALGSRYLRQWGAGNAPVDFADMKADVEALLSLASRAESTLWRPVSHPALHPGQAAEIVLGGVSAGWVGTLHPRLIKALDLPEGVVAFELSAAALARPSLPQAKVPGRFPRIQRDLAVVVPEAVTAAALLDAVRSELGSLLEEASIFDVYRGKGVEAGLKSIAMSLILQDSSRTLTDEDTDAAFARVMKVLTGTFGAALRN